MEKNKFVQLVWKNFNVQGNYTFKWLYGYNVPARHEDVIQYLLTGNADPFFGQN